MSANITENPLFNELFGTSETTAKNLQESQTKAEHIQPEATPIKENEQVNIFPYRLENLKQKLSDFLLKLKQAGASYEVNHNIHKRIDLTIEIKSFVKINCENKILQADLLNEINNDAELKTLLILNFARYDNDTRFIIDGALDIYVFENASNNKHYTPDLFLAVLSRFREVKESEKNLTDRYDTTMEAILKRYYQDSENEFKKFGIPYSYYAPLGTGNGGRGGLHAVKEAPESCLDIEKKFFEIII